MNNIFTAFSIALLIAIGIGVLLSFPIMLLWNYCLVPAAPTLAEITWLQSWGLYILFNILFKSNNNVSNT